MGSEMCIRDRDPFLVCFSNILAAGGKGIVRACADDISFALSRLKHIRLLVPIYNAAERLAGLMLHLKKSIIVPLIKKDAVKYHQIKQWMSSNIPTWCQLQVEDSAKLLGFYVGPAAGEHNWTGPISKLRDKN